MKLRLSTLLGAIAALVFAPLACTGSGDDGLDDLGGAPSTGGGPASGGASSTGGASATGGARSSGGTGGLVGTGGQEATGGTSSGGGAPGCGSGGLGGMGGFGGLGGVSGDFYPEGLIVTTPPNSSWELVMTAFTLVEGPDGPEAYVAVRNDGDVPTCAVQLSIELFDACGTSLGSAINTLKHPSHYFYSIDDENEVVIACLGPGETSMGRVSEFPPGIDLGAATVLRYRAPSFKLKVEERFEEVSLLELEPVSSNEGIAYEGILDNAFEAPVTGAYVTVFPTTASGRPLGMTTIEAIEAIPAGAGWTFETPAVTDAGADHAAFFDYDSPL
jgi:hypothetical protein